jgi:hypothetical protein
MKQSLRIAGLLLTTALASFGCNQAGNTPASSTTKQTTTTETRTTESTPEAGPNHVNPGARVDAGPHGATATGQTARGDGVDVDVGPNGGVGVDVQGEPLRDRIRERRAAREENVPR